MSIRSIENRIKQWERGVITRHEMERFILSMLPSDTNVATAMAFKDHFMSV